ncbi:MAG: extracellular solute-binding protein, partial [Limnochordia bacterium]|nr:extracellular solute-binding protein [Limnochordia bacterium]
MFRRRTKYIILTFSVIFVLTMSSNHMFAAEEKVSIVFYHRGYTTEVEWAEAVIERFEALNPHIMVESLSSGSGGGSEFSEKLTVLVASGNAPDVFYGSTDKLGFILKGWTRDLMPFIERDATEIALDDFFPGVMDSFVRSGAIHGIPLTVTPQLIFYNKDMFAEAGTSAPPSDWNDTQWTWDAFIDVSRKLTVTNADGTYSQLALSQATDMQLPDVSWMFGGDWFDEEAYRTGYPTHSTMLTTENVIAFEAIADLYAHYAAAGPRKGIDTYYGFGRGQIAMDWIGAYKLNNYVETQRAGGMSFAWGLAATPL